MIDAVIAIVQRPNEIIELFHIIENMNFQFDLSVIAYLNLDVLGKRTLNSRTFTHLEVVKDFFLQSCENNSMQRKRTTELCPEGVRYKVSLIQLCGFCGL